MKVKWLGHACFLITSTSGTRIITDPYEPNFNNIISYAPVNETADIVTTSHQHGDHNYTKDSKGKFDVVVGPGKKTVKGIEFTGMPCYHDRVEGKQRGPNTIYSFTLDGIHVCHFGDLGHPLDNAVIKSLGKVDVLFIPTGGPAATLELDEAAHIWDALKPALIIPMHFKNDKCTFPKYTVKDLLALKPNAKMVGKTEIELSAASLPKGELWILDHAL